MTVKDRLELQKKLRNYSNLYMNLPEIHNKIFIWGTGSSAEYFLRNNTQIYPYAFIDNYKSEEYFMGKLIFRPQEVDFSDPKLILIVASEFYDQIFSQAVALGANPKYIISSVILEINNVDNVVISYQKSGRTWIRMMIGRVLQQTFNLPEEEILKMTLTPNLFKNISNFPKIIFHHDDQAHVKNESQLNKSREYLIGKKVVLLVRDPRSVIVSNFFHMTYRAKTNELALQEFVLKYYPALIRYYNIWSSITYLNHRVFRYEDFRLNTVENLKNIIDFFYPENIIGSEIIEEAVNYCSLDKMREYALENKFSESILSEVGDARGSKIRTGSVAGFDSILNKELLNYCNKLGGGLNKIYDYSF